MVSIPRDEDLMGVGMRVRQRGKLRLRHVAVGVRVEARKMCFAARTAGTRDAFAHSARARARPRAHTTPHPWPSGHAWSTPAGAPSRTELGGRERAITVGVPGREHALRLRHGVGSGEELLARQALIGVRVERGEVLSAAGAQ